jgi:hypothetical protein
MFKKRFLEVIHKTFYGNLMIILWAFSWACIVKLLTVVINLAKFEIVTDSHFHPSVIFEQSWSLHEWSSL